MKLTAFKRVTVSLILLAFMIISYSFLPFISTSHTPVHKDNQNQAEMAIMYLSQSYVCLDDPPRANCSLYKLGIGGSSRDTLFMYNNSLKSVYMYVLERTNLNNKNKAGAFKDFVFMQTNGNVMMYTLKNIYKK